MQDSHSCDPGSIPGRRSFSFPSPASFPSPPCRLHPRRGAVPAAAVPRHAGPGGRGAEQGPDPGGAAGVRGAGRAAGAGGGRGRGAARRALRAGAAAGALAALGHRPAGAAQHRCLRGGRRVAQPAAPHPAGRVTGLGELGGHGARHPGPHREHQHDAHLRAAVHAGPVPGCRRAAEAWRCALHLWALRRGWPDQPPEQRGLRPQPEAEQSHLGAAGHGAAAGAGRGQRAVPGEDGGHAGQQQEPDLPQAVTRPDSTSSAPRHCCSH